MQVVLTCNGYVIALNVLDALLASVGFSFPYFLHVLISKETFSEINIFFSNFTVFAACLSQRQNVKLESQVQF